MRKYFCDVCGEEYELGDSGNVSVSDNYSPVTVTVACTITETGDPADVCCNCVADKLRGTFPPKKRRKAKG